jgi:hypothetical protein
MKTENCADITDAKRIELKSGLCEPGERHQYGDFIVPAGILIGLGVGLLAGHLGSGFLVGLGLGIVVSVLLPLFTKSPEGAYLSPKETNVPMLLFGAFLVLLAISGVWAPVAIWPYATAGFLILAGVWFLVRGFSRIA